MILVNIGSGNGLSPAWHQAITWTSSDILSIAPNKLQWNFYQNIEIFM